MKIESFKKACELQGYDPNARPDVSMLPARYQKSTVATFELGVISEASRKKDPDWNDSDEWKWVPVFDMEKDENNPTGFRFYGSGFAGAYSCSSGGSRICFDTEEESDYHGRQHIGLFRDAMVIEPK